MPTRDVILNILTRGGPEARREIALTGAAADKLNSKKVVFSVGMDGFTTIMSQTKIISTSLDKLNTKTARPEIAIRGTGRALAEIALVSAALNSLDRQIGSIGGGGGGGGGGGRDNSWRWALQNLGPVGGGGGGETGPMRLALPAGGGGGRRDNGPGVGMGAWRWMFGRDPGFGGARATGVRGIPNLWWRMAGWGQGGGGGRPAGGFGGGGGGRGAAGMFLGGQQLRGLAAGGPSIWGPAATLAALLIPSAVGLGIGSLVGAGVAGGAFKLASTAKTTLTADQQAVLQLQQRIRYEALAARVATTPGARAKALLLEQQARYLIKPLYAQQNQDKALYAPFLPLNNVFTGVGGVFTRALGTVVGHAASGGAAPAGHLQGTTGTPATGLMAIFGPLATFIKTLGPQLAQMFKASLPCIQMFVHLLEIAAKILLPVFTASMKQFAPVLPIIQQGFVALIKGLAGFIQLMGPVFHTSAVAFLVVMKVIQGLLLTFGVFIVYVNKTLAMFVRGFKDLGKALIDVVHGDFGGAMRALADIGHTFTDWFDHMRHAVALALDNMGFAKFGHTVATIFDQVRHDISHWWTIVRRDTFDVVVRFLTQTIPTALQLMRDLWHLAFLKIEIVTASAIIAILGFFSHLPGGVGKSAGKARDAMKAELVKMQNDVNTTVGKINAEWNKLHNKQVTVTEKGVGIFSITATGNSSSNPFLHPVHHAAAGGLITGGIPGIDSVPFLGMRGEVVVPTHMVNAGAVDHLRGRLPGFASGGLVNTGDPGVWSGRDVRQFDARFESRFTSAMERAMTSAMKTARTAALAFHLTGGGALGGSAAQNMAIARRMFPWSASEWPSFNYVEMREAGYSLTAQNPSGAYGMAQFINGPSEYFQWGGNPNTAGGQLTAMFNYIRSRYVTPSAAAAHEAAFNWYGNGFHGIISHPMIMGVGENGPERVDITPHPMVRTTDGCITINVYCHPTTHPAEIGREIVTAIKQYEKRSGASWRR